MFAGLLSDADWSNHSHRGWTTLISFAVQVLAVGSLLLLPLFYTEGLPRLALLAPLLTPAPPPAAPLVPPRSAATPPAQSNLMGNTLISPPEIPPTVNMPTETSAPQPMVDLSAVDVRHGTGDPNSRGNVFDSILGSNQILPPPPAAAVHHLPTSHMMEGNLVHRVQPEYPALARQARVRGQVLLQAIISRDGAIENLQVLRGHPMLVQAALDAVRQWRYRPYVLNGEPVEVETQVTVNFVLGGG